MKLKKPRWFISLYKGWLQNIFVLGLQYVKLPYITFTLRNKLCIHYYGQIITKIALAIVGPLWNKFPRNVRQADVS